ncbi:hypothetical protein P879_11117 [Paragonimus westermani]|uniref:Uncharacterized protein n=1 Tax=Paragonimus westermani TaxID=34504 RepID=A0A8T0DCR1_9TREM|nr:hypothetical protein P879_11117 [Paragonimus westermani]
MQLERSNALWINLSTAELSLSTTAMFRSSLVPPVAMEPTTVLLCRFTARCLQLLKPSTCLLREYEKCVIVVSGTQQTFDDARTSPGYATILARFNPGLTTQTTPMADASDHAVFAVGPQQCWW